MISRPLLALLLSSVLVLGACEQGRQKETAGTVLGGVGGALLGSQFGGGTGRLISTAVGTLAGAFIGNQVGAGLDKADQAQMVQAEQKAYTAPIGEKIAWNNPDSGNSGSVTPVRDGTAANGQYCREYQHSVVIDGKTQNAYGTACRQPDGSWKIIG
jgi:surface antigen